MEDKLLPCPFCGGEAKLHSKRENNHSQSVLCLKCDIRLPVWDDEYYTSKDNAIKAWNTRVGEK